VCRECEHIQTTQADLNLSEHDRTQVFQCSKCNIDLKLTDLSIRERSRDDKSRVVCKTCVKLGTSNSKNKNNDNDIEIDEKTTNTKIIKAQNAQKA